jgi:putative membrane protein
MADERIPTTASSWQTSPQRVAAPPDPRLSWANERTFLAWNRTALALIGGGLAVAQLLHLGVGGERLLIGLPLIALGAAAGVAGISRWRASERAMRLRAPLPPSRLSPALLAAGTAWVAVVSLTLLSLSLLRQ